jgi:hypothetical protein
MGRPVTHGFSLCLTQRESGGTGLEQGTTLLLGLPGVAVQRVEIESDGGRLVHVVTADPDAAACPSCRVVSTSGKQLVRTRPKDLPYGAAPLRVVWHKRAAPGRPGGAPHVRISMSCQAGRRAVRYGTVLQTRS